MEFEKYLQDKHAEQYQGLDDGIPDDFNDWLEGLSSDEWIEYATKWHNYKMQQHQKQIEEVRGMLKEQIRKLQEYVGGGMMNKELNGGNMKRQKIGLVKDILWYLKGAIELRSICELKDYHLEELARIIEEAEKKEGKEK